MNGVLNRKLLFFIGGPGIALVMFAANDTPQAPLHAVRLPLA